jgi:predicted SAM-dependent methyltransferase
MSTESPTPRLLDLGCGRTKRPGAIGVDRNPVVGADVLADLDRTPYPFGVDSFDEILLDNVLEHLADVPATMRELFRIARPGALLIVKVPFFRSKWAAIDPTHRHFFTVASMSYFDSRHPFHDQYRYADIDLRVERVSFNDGAKYAGAWGRVARPVARLANHHPERYELWLSQFIPLDELRFDLRVIK